VGAGMGGGVGIDMGAGACGTGDGVGGEGVIGADSGRVPGMQICAPIIRL
jgi:hypothetical protein